MNIVEALKFSNSILNQKLRRSIDITNNKDTRHINLTTEEIFSNDWTPIVEIHEKINVEKTFYQAVFSCKDESRIFISDILFANSKEAETYAKEHAWCFHKLLTDSPIEVEVKT